MLPLPYIHIIHSPIHRSFISCPFNTIIMIILPSNQAYITELIPTKADNMVAADNFLNEHLAVWAPLEVLEIVLEVLVALSPWMCLHHALTTIPTPTFVTLWWLLCQVHHPITAVLVGADLYIWVVDGLSPEGLLIEPSLGCFG